MRLSELMQHVSYQLVGEDIDIGGIAYDSRKVEPGFLFAAVSGLKHDGHDYVSEAVARGAAAVLVERVVDTPVPQVLVEDTRFALGHAAAAFYGYPAKQLKVIGVTGTNGKTTTTYMVRSILEQAGKRVGLIGTIETVYNGQSRVSDRTTPESLDLQRILADMAADQVEYVVMEVSSHALALHRTNGMEFRAGIFTNLTQDHLDFHETLEDYFQSKARLFNQVTAFAVINCDDLHGAELMAQVPVPTISYGVDRAVQVQAVDIEVGPKQTSYTLKTPWGTAALELRLTGRFNVYNSLAAAAVCLGEGVAIEHVKRGLESLQGVPGRFEVVDEGQPFTVIVDYAHTPDGLENILRTARSMTQGRVVVVFGAGGDRDRSKRPLMGEIAVRLADRVIITSDNPRSEDPQVICADILAGVKKIRTDADYAIQVDRRSAIRQALAEARPSDIILIAGKGHETYQEIQGVRTHFDDREEARKALKELYS